MADSSTADGTPNHEAQVEEEDKTTVSTGGSDEGSDGKSGASAASPTEDDKKTPSLTEAVRAALNPEKEQSSGSGEKEGDDSKKVAKPGDDKTSKGEDEELGELTDEELNSYKPKTRRRIETLNKQVKSLQDKIDQEAPDVQNYRTIQGFVKKAGLSREEVNTGFQIMNLLKNDPEKGYHAFLPIWTELCELVGVTLPKDLREQVTSGKITEDHANELSRLRASRNVTTTLEQQRNDTEAQNRQREAAEGAQQLSTAVGQAITDWESRWKASDPDFSLKQARVTEAIELELQRELLLAKDGKPNKLPRSVEESIVLADRVKKRVEKEMSALIPKRNKSITPLTGNGATQSSKPVAKTMFDVVAQAVGHR